MELKIIQFSTIKDFPSYHLNKRVLIYIDIISFSNYKNYNMKIKKNKKIIFFFKLISVKFSVFLTFYENIYQRLLSNDIKTYLCLFFKLVLF